VANLENVRWSLGHYGEPLAFRSGCMLKECIFSNEVSHSEKDSFWSWRWRHLFLLASCLAVRVLKNTLFTVLKRGGKDL